MYLYLFLISPYFYHETALHAIQELVPNTVASYIILDMRMCCSLVVSLKLSQLQFQQKKAEYFTESQSSLGWERTL